MKMASVMETWRCWCCLTVVTIACITSSLATREAKAITWADILRGKSGYPSVNLQGYQSNKLNTINPLLLTTSTTPIPDLAPVYSTESNTYSKNNQKYKSAIESRKTLTNNAPWKPVFNTQKDVKYHTTTTTTPSAPRTTIQEEYKFEVYTDRQQVQHTTPTPTPKRETIKNNFSKVDKFRSKAQSSKKNSAPFPYIYYQPTVRPITQTTEPTTTPSYTTDTPDEKFEYISTKDIPRVKAPQNPQLFTYDFNNLDEYDESFFNNDYYEYIDTENNKQEKQELIESQTNDPEDSQQADRRALDFLYHMFMDPNRHSTKNKRPFLIEEVLSTIDKHIIEDVQAFSENRATNNLLSQLYQTPQAASSVPSIYLPPIVDTAAVASSPGSLAPSGGQGPLQPTIDFLAPSTNLNIGTPLENAVQASQPTQEYLPPLNPTVNSVQSPAGSNGEEFLVTDELGKQYLVSIDDIITSLAQLDEREVTNLLLGDSGGIPLPSGVAGTAGLGGTQPAPATSGSTGIPLSAANANSGSTGGIPLSQVKSGAQTSGNIERPTRQIDNNIIPSEDEVFLIKGSDGSMQIITINDVLDSLERYKNKKVVQPSFETSGINLSALSELIKNNENNPTISNFNIQDLLTQNRNPTVLSQTISSTPIVSNDVNGNIVLSLAKKNQPKLIDLKDEHVNLPKKVEETPQSSLVKTDDEGNVHIYPDPTKPFTFDIKKIIDLAEKAESQRYITEPTTTTTSTTTENPKTGEDIFEFLLGGAENLPRPIRSSKPLQTSQPKLKDNSAQAQLLSVDDNTNANKNDNNEILQQDNNHNIFQLLQSQAQNIVPPTRYLQQIAPAIPSFQPVQQEESQGFTSTLSNLFSRLIGRDESNQTPNQPALPTEPPQTYDNNIIRLVVRQQDRGPTEQIFGHVNIELPRPIHYQDTTARPIVTPSSFNSVDSNRRVLDLGNDNPNVPQARNIRQNNLSPQALASNLQNAKLSPMVQSYIISQLNNRPKFKLNKIPSLKARKDSLPTIRSREDSSYTSINTVPYNNVHHYPTHESEYSYVYSDPSPYQHGSVSPGYSTNVKAGDEPLFGLNLLADIVKVEKVGKKNKSVSLPKIGDPTEFVNTRKYHYYRR